MLSIISRFVIDVKNGWFHLGFLVDFELKVDLNYG